MRRAQGTLGVAHDRLRAKPDAATADHHAGPVRSAAFDDSIGIGQEQPSENLVVRFAAGRTGVQPLPDGRWRPSRSSRRRATCRAATGSMPRDRAKKRIAPPRPRPASRAGRGHRKRQWRAAALVDDCAGSGVAFVRRISFSDRRAAIAAPSWSRPASLAAISKRASRGWTGRSSMA